MIELPDNTVMPFEIKPLGVRGRIVRLGHVVDDILHKHDYPAPVSALLAEAVALTAMLGASQQSEQSPTRLRLAAGALAQRGTRTEAWRAGAIMVQHLPRDGGISPQPFHSGDAPEGHEEHVVEDDHWVKARLLLDTVED